MRHHLHLLYSIYLALYPHPSIHPSTHSKTGEDIYTKKEKKEKKRRKKKEKKVLYYIVQ